MVDKETTEFSRGSFKEKILRQLEENAAKQAETKFPDPEDFERPKGSEPVTSERKIEPRKVELEPFKLPVFKFPEADEEEDFQAQVEENTSQETGSLRQKLEEIVSDENQEQTFPPPFSRSESAVQEEPIEQENISEKRESEKMVKHQPSRRTTAPSKKNSSGKKNKNKKKKKVTAGKIITVIVVLLILVVGGTGWYGYNFVKSGIQPLDSKNTTVKSISIPAGSSSKQIGEILQRQSIIKNGMIFQYYTKFKNYSEFKSGYYNLSPNMSLSTIASKLEEGGTEKPVAPTLGKILIPEGYTLTQIAKAVTVNSNSQEKNAKTPFSEADFMKTVQDPTFIAKMVKAYPKLFASLPTKDSGIKYQLEGYLFPATYDYTKSSTVESVIENMIEAMNAQLTPYYDTMTQKNLTVNDVLSLAALVEKEANNDDDRRNVAATFYNRMNQGMTLGSNLSILYAEGKLGEKTSLAEDANIDTNLDSPYNLYANTGFGPGPVDSPSLSSIKAVLNPAQNDYLYFVADVTTGKVYFAKTLEEQNANVQKYVNDKLSK
ncbi:MAG: endolytic transglycosylase MltG [Lactococcus cremoris]|uniref:Endolytic murein transglycosylase n=1 Tax=Lactococcus cremoris subsp. cremoris IBB477 TaxID=1449093 RepID=A0A1E7G1Z2_LACLC|nr:endolytic transglycosylase MltG [Lactococcus cremoris]KZK07446.1 protein YceG like [Lactococcus cremoris]MCT0455990.1 endolytic transglycosylase MltG [Lactococcus cremoris]MCT0475593.1 endolytic transglycosylase MltG [Lactococcus cremoris]MCT0477052.1 endolytic transglycosylase MltG [Lactococcus cremoris]MCT0499556.1 endolytic transglycosylase MltG [Lactococcus cremoris]